MGARIHVRFVRLFHKDRATQAWRISAMSRLSSRRRRLAATCVAAKRKGDQETVDQLAWVERACDDEFDGAAAAAATPAASLTTRRKVARTL
jgi:hypothetical protein